ncbi:unnamed protein product [Tuber melanosporum]|uniref:(Perigord truffle) hypothetical protein n=1 Tax=Tuber melanosporum (strain Mel28) TaxID=656061 RepID=D5GAQ9_TUBMM|nr:uncharacterized protein GSTUM_00003746001 [Tuber melanosporum]CAZ81602.1 unnamed protein product [Tuber melanosporum]
MRFWGLLPSSVQYDSRFFFSSSSSPSHLCSYIAVSSFTDHVYQTTETPSCRPLHSAYGNSIAARYLYRYSSTHSLAVKGKVFLTRTGFTSTVPYAYCMEEGKGGKAKECKEG